MLKYVSALVALLVIISCDCFAETQTQNSVKGIAFEKPNSGPFVKTDQGYMVPYEETIPGTEITFRMTPIAGGEVLLGSPETETGRVEDEGPQVTLPVSPMWVACYEVTWAEYKAFFKQYMTLKEIEDLRYTTDRPTIGDPNSAVEKHFGDGGEVDAFTCPTPLYDPSFTYEAGDADDLPAVTMTQYAAKQYTKWLSGITEQDYRLPTEAEWEYAARAGSKSAYSFGNDVATLDEYAWYANNAEEKLHPVGSKKPNAWGLYDMHGNAAEWVLDAYGEEGYKILQESVQGNQGLIANWPTELYPRVIRGGSWQDSAEKLRSAARFQSADEDWTLSDPNLPLSPWWLTETETLGIGMRIVRPLEPMTSKIKEQVWEADFEDLQLDLEDRMAEGRGTRALATPTLPAAVKELRETK